MADRVLDSVLKIIIEDLQADLELDAVTLSIDQTHELFGRMIRWVRDGDVAFQFLPINGIGVDNTYSGALAGKDIELAVTNGMGTVDSLNSFATVVATIASGTATGKKLNGSTSPVTLTVSEGKVTITVSATGAGTVLIALSGGNTSLDLSDTATVTLS